MTTSLSPVLVGERSILDNLAQLYCHDWSELTPLEAGPDGRFDALVLAPYWLDDWRHPLLVRVDGKVAGFALIAARSRLTGRAGVFDMAEFFIMRGYRRRGVGLTAACAAFERFRGPWEVRQRVENPTATAFWRRTIGEFTGGNYKELRWDAPEWSGLVQTFDSSIQGVSS